MNRIVGTLSVIAMTACAGSVLALSSDSEQQLLLDANHQKSTQSQSGKAGDPNITHLDGNVVMVQGSMKGRGDNAVIYQNPTGVADSNGTVGGVTRVVLTGKQAHMQQVHDGDCMLMTADADTIDYHTDTKIALLTGNVHVVQKGKGDFHSEHLIYNTKTGEMESGNTSPTDRVHMVMEPKSAEPAKESTNNCGFPAGRAKAKAAPAATEAKP